MSAVCRHPIRVGRGRPEHGEYRSSKGRLLPSVTEVVGCWGETDGLVRWASIETAEALLGGAEFWDAVQAPVRIRDEAGEHGSYVHEALEARWSGRPVALPKDDAAAWDVTHAMRRVLGWFDQNPHLTIIATEVRLEGRLTGGTVDWVCLNTLNAKLVLGDLKTGGSAGQGSESWALQLGAYRGLVEQQLGGEVDSCFALHVPRREPRAKARAYHLHTAWLEHASEAYQHLVAAWYQLEPLRSQLGLPTRIETKKREIAKAVRKSQR